MGGDGLKCSIQGFGGGGGVKVVRVRVIEGESGSLTYAHTH